MNDPKPFASLSSGLLARKGAAKPAMRPQLIGTISSAGIEDLGWNDMGGDTEADVASPAIGLTPAPAAREPEQEIAPAPPVVEQQRAIAASFGPIATAPAPAAAAGEVIPLPVVRARAGSRAKAAFTLRLDEQRHLRLRLACAIQHRSAQQVVTEALDTFLNALPELDTLAQHVPAKQAKRN
jgi:hypothetical protein